MEPSGEVGCLMNLGGENTGGEILRSLLMSAKMQKNESVGVNILPDLESSTHTDDQIVFQIELDEVKSEFIPRNENIIQHIPVTYLSAENPNLNYINNPSLVEPITYVLSRDFLPESTRYYTVGGEEPQKIILVQEVESQASKIQYYNHEVKSYSAKESQTGNDINSNYEVVEEDKKKKTENCNGKKVKEEPGEGKVKVEKKISTIKRQLNKRKNSKFKTKVKTLGKALLKKPKKPLKSLEEENPEKREKDKRNNFNVTKLEDNVDQVAERLKIGCECIDSNCFDGLKPDDVLQHRLNIADLTKAEHDMYLMGILVASINNSEETCRHKERIRIRSCYAYQGKKVCLTAFLYLQRVTHYQMKRLRSHLKHHGVSPRIHGNRGKKPANTLSLDIYCRAANFVQKYIEKNSVKIVQSFTNPVETNKLIVTNKMTSYHLPPECTKRILHGEYKSFCESLKSCQKVMKYSTFTSFLKKQFPNVKFLKKEDKKQEKLANNKEDTKKKSQEDKGVDKCVQVDKALYFPSKTQILINGEQLEMYDESGDDSRVKLGSQNPEHIV